MQMAQMDLGAHTSSKKTQVLNGYKFYALNLLKFGELHSELEQWAPPRGALAPFPRSLEGMKKWIVDLNIYFSQNK